MRPIKELRGIVESLEQYSNFPPNVMRSPAGDKVDWLVRRVLYLESIVDAVYGKEIIKKDGGFVK